MKTKQFPIIVGIVAMIMALAMSLTGCNDNNEETEEYMKYSWYIKPDTARGEDGKLYFHEKRFDGNNGFIDNITGIKFKKAFYPHSDYEAYVSRVYKSWSIRFELTGDLIRPSHNYPLFREYCIKYGVRPVQRTPFDEEMQRVLPCYDWEANDLDLCCDPIIDIKVITHRDFDANHPAGTDIADIMRFHATYLDDYVAWYRTNYTDYPKFSDWYWLKDPDSPIPFKISTIGDLQEYIKAPRSLVLNGLSSIGSHVIPQLPGDYPLTVTITLASGKEVSAEAVIKVV